MDVTGIVLHYTAAGNARGTIQWFATPDSKVSAHFVIGRDGQTTQMVSLEDAAWHAGSSEMFYKGNLVKGANSFTIGIELCNYGLLQEGDDGFCYEDSGIVREYKGKDAPQRAALIFDALHGILGAWEPYPETQLLALEVLLKLIEQAGYKDAVKNLVGHEEIAVPIGRKFDPGPLFPWARFGRPAGTRRTKALVNSIEV